MMVDITDGGLVIYPRHPNQGAVTYQSDFSKSFADLIVSSIKMILRPDTEVKRNPLLIHGDIFVFFKKDWETLMDRYMQIHVCSKMKGNESAKIFRRAVNEKWCCFISRSSDGILANFPLPKDAEELKSTYVSVSFHTKEELGELHTRRPDFYVGSSGRENSQPLDWSMSKLELNELK